MSAVAGRTRSRTDGRPPSSAAATSRARGRGHVLVAAALLGVVAVLAVAAWSLTAGRQSPTAPAGTVVMDSGVARVDRVVSAARPQHAMPGMGSDDDPVAEGERRVSVEVTLRASEDGPLSFSVDRFTLRVPGGAPRPPHRSVLPETEMPAGTTLSGVLVFDVPRAATVGQLSYGSTGRATQLILPAEQGSAPAPSDTGSAPGSPEPSHSSTGHDPGSGTGG